MVRHHKRNLRTKCEVLYKISSPSLLRFLPFLRVHPMDAAAGGVCLTIPWTSCASSESLCRTGYCRTASVDIFVTSSHSNRTSQ
ncbi:hypothetical protein OSTOST_21660 [Ostertagia ostertagi]